MIIDIINDFRQTNGKERIFCWDPAENDYCLQHSLHMARINNLEHAPAHLLKGKAEAIGMSDFNIDTNNTSRFIIFELMGNSTRHREIILNYDNLAYGVFMHNWKVYLTIRGW